MPIMTDDISPRLTTNMTHFLEIHPELAPDLGVAFLQEKIDSAVELYTRDSPACRNETVTMTTQTQAPIVQGWDRTFSEITRIESPIGMNPRCYLPKFSWEVFYDSPTVIELRRPLTIGDMIRVEYIGAHVDTVALSTLELSDIPMVKLLAAWLAANAISAKMNDWVPALFQENLPSSTESLSTRWRNLATEFRAEYDGLKAKRDQKLRRVELVRG